MSLESEYWQDQTNQARAEAQDWQEKYEALRTDFDTLMEGLREIEQAISGVRSELSKELERLSQDQGKIAQPRGRESVSTAHAAAAAVAQSGDSLPQT